MHFQFLYRQLWVAKQQSLIFILCVALAIVTLATLNGFADNVKNALARDSKQLFASDIIISSRFPFSSPTLERVEQLRSQQQIEAVNTFEFNSVIRSLKDDNSLLSNLKVVGPQYPFYGELKLESNKALKQVLTSGTAIADNDFFERLNLSQGDSIQVGNTQLKLVDKIVHEPDRSVQFFNIGPRLMIAEQDLEATNLAKLGSRISYKILIKVTTSKDSSSLDTQVSEIAEQLKQVIQQDTETVETYLTAESSIQVFLENLRLFLNLVGVFTLLLAGIGIHTSLTAWLKEHRQSIAIIKALGATNDFIIRHYYILCFTVGSLGVVLGIGVSLGLQALLISLLGNMIDASVEVGLSITALIQSVMLGLVIIMAFTFTPLYQLKQFKPNQIFQHASVSSLKGLGFYCYLLAIIGIFISVLVWQLGSLAFSLRFIASMLLLIAGAWCCSYAMLHYGKALHFQSLPMRQALRGLFRPDNATMGTVLSLSTAVGVIFCIYLIELNLNQNYVQAYPDDTDNVVFLDIQPNQLKPFDQLLNKQINTTQTITYYPVIRATITHLKDKLLDRETEKNRDRDDFSRSFSMTYRDQLAANEILVKGDSLFNASWEKQGIISVSILDYIIENRDINIGDNIRFRIQGVPITARISSIRKRIEDDLSPYFVFVFPTKVLQDAPQTIFTSLKVEDINAIPALQNTIIKQFPNISVINISDSIQRLSELLNNLSSIIRTFSLLSILAGILIIISSIFSTRITRTREAVYYKILGAKKQLVLKIFTLENAFLGFISAVLALIIGLCGSWAICYFIFNISFNPFIIQSLAVIALTVVLVIGIGLGASIAILNTKPIQILRQQGTY